MKCLSHELDLRIVGNLCYLAAVTAHQELGLPGIHHHAVLGEPGA